MLQTIHDKLKGIFAIVILVALGVVFVFWGVDVSVGGFTRARGIEVNGREIPVADVQQSYQDQLSRYQAAFGDAGVPEEMQEALQQNVLEQSVRTELIRQRTRKLRYATTDAEVLAAIREVPAFQVNGEFSPDAYHAALRSINLSSDQFEAEQREFVLARQLDRGLYASAFVLPAELERSVALRREVRTLGWLAVPAERFLAEIVLDDDAIRAHYEAHQSEYLSEESATVHYVLLDIDEFAADVTVEEAELRAYYEEIRGRYTEPGRRRARHVLFEEGDDPAAAEAGARRAADRAKAGEDFAALARELSDDAGSREAGGDLGFAARDDLDPAFAEALWAMAPGEIRGPVKSEFGWHVIKLEEVDPETVRTFEEVRAELEPEYRRAQVEKAFGDAQEELDTLAFEANGDLGTVAARMQRPVRRIERFTRAGGGELGADRALIEAVFSGEVLAGRELRTVELGPGRVAAVGASSHEPARPRPLEEVRSRVIESARMEQAAKRAQEQAAALVEQLKGGTRWSDIAARWKSESGRVEPGPVRRDDPDVPAPVREAAFASPVAAGNPAYGATSLANGDSAVWTVTSSEPGRLAALPPEERQQAHDETRDRTAMSDANVYVTSMRASAEVDVNPQLFE